MCYKLKDINIPTSIEKIEGYAFKHTKNNLILTNNNDKNKSLICSCEKDGKNGILIIFIDEKSNEKLVFFETNDFEVYCFYGLEKNRFFAAGYEKGGKVKLFNLDYINHFIKNTSDIDTIGEAAIIYLLKFEEKKLSYLQNQKIFSITINSNY